jgi:hypothetical protein
MPSPNRKLSLRSRIKNVKSQLGTFGKAYEFTAARQKALETAQKASAEARRLAGNKVGGSQGLSSVQIIANRFANRLTGSKTSALRKRQTVKAQISTTAKTAGSTARSLTGTASTLYRGYKSTATRKLAKAGIVSTPYSGRGNSMNSSSFNQRAAAESKATTATPRTRGSAVQSKPAASSSTRGSAVQSKPAAASSIRGGMRSEAAWKAARRRTIKKNNPNLNSNAINQRVNLEWQRKKNKTGKRVTR